MRSAFRYFGFLAAITLALVARIGSAHDNG